MKWHQQQACCLRPSLQHRSPSPPPLSPVSSVPLCYPQGVAPPPPPPPSPPPPPYPLPQGGGVGGFQPTPNFSGGGSGNGGGGGGGDLLYPPPPIPPLSSMPPSPAHSSWTTHDSPELGKPYFVHVGTGRVSWLAPPPGDTIANLPPTWVVRTSGDGVVYFRNDEEGRSSYSVPEGGGNGGGSSGSGGFVGLATFAGVDGGGGGVEGGSLQILLLEALPSPKAGL